MTTVITYGTYDRLHYGHIRLLERARALGDKLIVGVTSDDFDRSRGKLNVQQSLIERIEAVRSTGLADQIIVEEYEGQKIDDIRRYEADIFTVGSDWRGKFDYLGEYCRVVYLERTEGVSSTEIRAQEGKIRLGLAGENRIVEKYFRESAYVNGAEVAGVCTRSPEVLAAERERLFFTEDYGELLARCDAVYLVTPAEQHYEEVKRALSEGRHVLCESPVALSAAQCRELFKMAKERNLVLMDAVKTAYAQAYSRLLLLVKTGRIGKVRSVDAVCTSLAELQAEGKAGLSRRQNSLCEWGPTALLPIFQLLGCNYREMSGATWCMAGDRRFDLFTKLDFIYEEAVASIKVGKGVKSEGELVISGTEGYVVVPAPWWKTEYFEIRYENPADNRRYFYQLDGEGIRSELVLFLRSIQKRHDYAYLSPACSEAIAGVMEAAMARRGVRELSAKA